MKKMMIISLFMEMILLKVVHLGIFLIKFLIIYIFFKGKQFKIQRKDHYNEFKVAQMLKNQLNDDEEDENLE
jgi:hypothetical protein